MANERDNFHEPARGHIHEPGRDTRRDTRYDYDAAAIERGAASVLLNKISWSGVFAGALLALTVHLILNMMGIGIGAATIDPVQGETPSLAAFSIGAGIWWTISGIIAAFIGGYTASRLSGRPSRSTGGLQGVTAWALSIMVIFTMMTTTFGTIAGGAVNALTTATGTALQQIEPAAGEQALPGTLQTQEVQQAIGNVVTAMITQDQQAQATARQEAINVIAQAQNVSPAQAEQQLNQFLQQGLPQTEARVREFADEAATRVSQMAWFAVIALLLGAAAGWGGGLLGVRRPIAS